jgi:hypothetical protein
VLLHCVRAESRTPTVAALYGARVSQISPLEALEDVRRVLPSARPNPLFTQVAGRSRNNHRHGGRRCHARRCPIMSEAADRNMTSGPP